MESDKTSFGGFAQGPIPPMLDMEPPPIDNDYGFDSDPFGESQQQNNVNDDWCDFSSFASASTETSNSIGGWGSFSPPPLGSPPPVAKDQSKNGVVNDTNAAAKSDNDYSSQLITSLKKDQQNPSNTTVNEDESAFGLFYKDDQGSAETNDDDFGDFSSGFGTSGADNDFDNIYFKNDSTAASKSDLTPKANPENLSEKTSESVANDFAAFNGIETDSVIHNKEKTSLDDKMFDSADSTASLDKNQLNTTVGVSDSNSSHDDNIANKVIESDQNIDKVDLKGDRDNQIHGFGVFSSPDKNSTNNQSQEYNDFTDFETSTMQENKNSNLKEGIIQDDSSNKQLQEDQSKSGGFGEFGNFDAFTKTVSFDGTSKGKDDLENNEFGDFEKLENENRSGNEFASFGEVKTENQTLETKTESLDTDNDSFGRFSDFSTDNKDSIQLANNKGKTEVLDGKEFGDFGDFKTEEAESNTKVETVPEKHNVMGNDEFQNFDAFKTESSQKTESNFESNVSDNNEFGGFTDVSVDGVNQNQSNMQENQFSDFGVFSANETDPSQTTDAKSEFGVAEKKELDFSVNEAELSSIVENKTESSLQETSAFSSDESKSSEFSEDKKGVIITTNEFGDFGNTNSDVKELGNTHETKPESGDFGDLGTFATDENKPSEIKDAQKEIQTDETELSNACETKTESTNNVFGDFGTISTEESKSSKIEENKEENNFESNEFGDFGNSISEEVEFRNTPDTQTESSLASNDFGDFGAFSTDESNSSEFKEAQKDTSVNDNLENIKTEFNNMPDTKTESTIPDNDFGDFGAFSTDESNSNEIKEPEFSNTPDTKTESSLPDNDFGDFGAFSTDKSGQVEEDKKESTKTKDNEFGDFGQAEMDSGKSSILTEDENDFTFKDNNESEDFGAFNAVSNASEGTEVKENQPAVSDFGDFSTPDQGGKEESDFGAFSTNSSSNEEKDFGAFSNEEPSLSKPPQNTEKGDGDFGSFNTSDDTSDSKFGDFGTFESKEAKKEEKKENDSFASFESATTSQTASDSWAGFSKTTSIEKSASESSKVRLRVWLFLK